MIRNSSLQYGIAGIHEKREIFKLIELLLKGSLCSYYFLVKQSGGSPVIKVILSLLRVK